MKGFRYRRPSLKSVLGVTRTRKSLNKSLGITDAMKPFRAPGNAMRKMKRAAGYYSEPAKMLRAMSRGSTNKVQRQSSVEQQQEPQRHTSTMNIPIRLPQELLDKIHEADIAELASKLEQLNATQRKAEIRLSRQKLNVTKKQVRLEREGIIGRLDGRNVEHKYYKDLLAKPFELLEQFIGEIELGLTEVDAGREPHTLLYLCQRRFIGGNLITQQWGIDKLDSIITYLERMLKDIELQLPLLKKQKDERPFGWIGIGILFFACILGGLLPSTSDPGVWFGAAVLLVLGLPCLLYRRTSDNVLAQQSSLTIQHDLLQQQLEPLRRMAMIEKPPVTLLVQYPQALSSQNDDTQIIKSQMEAAKALIDAKNYQAARSLLATINHPKAKEWLARMDERGW